MNSCDNHVVVGDLEAVEEERTEWVNSIFVFIPVNHLQTLLENLEAEGSQDYTS